VEVSSIKKAEYDILKPDPSGGWGLGSIFTGFIDKPVFVYLIDYI